MGKKPVIAVCALLLGYFSFTSGMLFEVTKEETLNQMNLPYSIALSNYRAGIVAVPNDDDMACTKWMVDNVLEEFPVFTDYLGWSMLLSYEYGMGYADREYEGKHYIFLHTWNIENDKMVFGKSPGLRTYEALPELDDAVMVYRQGKAVVYEVKK